jgi:UDP-N-acetylglucosamine acyltransferase
MGLEKINNIHPTSIIGPDVKLGAGNYIGPYCVISGNTVIGDNNRFEAYCSIGSPAETIGYFDRYDCETIIGNNNIFREFVTINQGSTKQTIIGNKVIILRGSHVGHDSVIEDKVVIACNVILGGYSYVMEGCNLGLGTITHQFSKIGAYCMLGMGTVVTKTTKILPGGVYIGSPARRIKQNTVSITKNQVTDIMLEELIKKYNSIIIER